MPSNSSVPPATHYVADFDPNDEIIHAEDVAEDDKARSTWGDAWRALRSRAVFWISSALIVLIVFVALFPELLTSAEPNSQCSLSNSFGSPEPGHLFGFTRLGCDIFSRVVHGAAASLSVGLLAMFITTVIGVIIGAISGYYGGVVDAVLSRLGDMFYAIPTVLGAIVLMTVVPDRTALSVAFALALFAWPQSARITRGAIMTASKSDYVTASAALGVSKYGRLIKHVLPNSLAPIIVMATVSLGTFIVGESTLSFLGVGLPPSVMSWGNDIAQASTSIVTNPEVLFYPAAALSLTVLAFLLLGDAVRDALDPEERARR